MITANALTRVAGIAAVAAGVVFIGTVRAGPADVLRHGPHLGVGTGSARETRSASAAMPSWPIWSESLRV